jgi:His/Glu/Gln/Arg/opine family amino acid ABC transporter permease subunit
MECIINYELIYKSLPQLLSGFSYSLLISGSACLIGILGGLAIALMIKSKNFLLRWIAYSYVTIMRGTPMLIQLLILFFSLPLMGIYISSISVAIIAIGMNSMAYMSQVFLAGINMVPQGQLDAAQVMGMNRSQILQYILIPQTFRNVVPALINECITLIKDSSLAHIISVKELLYEGNIIINKTYDVVSIYFAIAIIFLLSTFCITLFFKYIEKKLS